MDGSEVADFVASVRQECKVASHESHHPCVAAIVCRTRVRLWKIGSDGEPGYADRAPEGQHSGALTDSRSPCRGERHECRRLGEQAGDARGFRRERHDAVINDQ